MRRAWLGAVVAVLLLVQGAAWACSVVAPSPAVGFLRARQADLVQMATMRLPANARGALFSWAGDAQPALAAADFSIEDEDGHALAAQLLPIDPAGMPPGEARSALWLVAPAGGFAPGRAYVLSGPPHADYFRYARQVRVRVDVQPLMAPEAELPQISVLKESPVQNVEDMLAGGCHDDGYSALWGRSRKLQVSAPPAYAPWAHLLWGVAADVSDGLAAPRWQRWQKREAALYGPGIGYLAQPCGAGTQTLVGFAGVPEVEGGLRASAPLQLQGACAHTLAREERVAGNQYPAGSRLLEPDAALPFLRVQLGGAWRYKEREVPAGSILFLFEDGINKRKGVFGYQLPARRDGLAQWVIQPQRPLYVNLSWPEDVWVQGLRLKGGWQWVDEQTSAIHGIVPAQGGAHRGYALEPGSQVALYPSGLLASAEFAQEVILDGIPIRARSETSFWPNGRAHNVPLARDLRVGAVLCRAGDAMVLDQQGGLEACGDWRRAE